MTSPSDQWKPVLRKVCGITRAQDARHASRAGANAIGMIFYPPSPRSVTADQAEGLAAAVPDGVRRVGVFVDERPEDIAALVWRAGLHTVQLSGRETAPDCSAVRSLVGRGIEVWKSVRVGPGFDASGLDAFDADAFLLDTARSGSFGGTGAVFPWELARLVKPFGRIIVAGGLDGSNVAEAARTARPWGVDSSSRLEIRPGVKDPAKVESYLRAVL